MSGLRPVAPDGCAPRCARLCTDRGLAEVLAAEQGLLHWRATRRLGDPGLAEHAVQEALLRAWRGCATYDPDRGSVRTWLLSIERNVLTDIIRMRAARPMEAGWDLVEDSVDLRWARPDFTDSLTDGLLVDQLLARLPGPQRDAVVQVILRDRAYRDVAADLGVPVGTVKTRVHYALRSLRQLPLGA
ncbi:sigma-70 family RNA polymerase sigma factor [Nocardia terpenica]|uniref:RNA polymerase subunit sigma-70 n=1 Tax=Nocardia terpenica TaxID=455432 RepID=A0A164JDX5_9NOCA|nr:sigma-70 family RNA polymerase sigma factor [Nocardia terpenica]KZM70306.1 RNA polymerase subunit sigma-70 [Nocardia terpenica]MBF6063978.1 sigma-70 family RNA polymerase sigma factor [Nocardia terpenica]MBF6107786.1 sigma-70 family RNA polymerase sigma factor [Nocardia terpenica]MBF6114854.1 sigma-70 family RNA polymerase sigma factor [Nocardia terpenica]MBF6121159.1 sigma-70 family RNA polymerase sigma factor [Nocardia terpenica]